MKVARGLGTKSLLWSLVLLILVLSGCGGSQSAPAAPDPAPAAKTEPAQPAAKPAAPAAPAAPVVGGTLTLAITTDPKGGLDPYKTPEGLTEEIMFNVLEGLVRPTAKGELVPGVAAKWDISPDGLTYTFTLKDGVKFHNGRDVTAEDVKFSLERILDPATKHSRIKDYKDIASVTVTNPKTVTVKLKKSNAAMLANLSVVHAGIHPKEAAADMAKAPVGTGPFKFVEWAPNQHIKLARFDQYHDKGLPYLNEVIFKVIPDVAAQLAALQTGAVDVIHRLDPAQLKAVQSDKNLAVTSGPMNLPQIAAMNAGRKPFSDVKVRQAVTMAIDRKAIIEGASHGKGTAIATHMTPATPFYRDLTSRFPYNPAKAKQLLTDAGYPGGFEMTMRLPENYTLHRATGEIIAAQLEQIGIKVKIEVIEWGRWLSEVYRETKYDMTVIGHTGRLDPDAVLNRWSAKNYTNWHSDEVKGLLAEGLKLTDPAERTKIYHKVQEIVTENAPALFIQDPHQLIAHRANTQGWQIYPIYVIDLRSVHKAAK